MFFTIFYFILLGRKLTGRVHDWRPEEVHQRDEEGLNKKAFEGFAKAILETSGSDLCSHHKQEVWYDHHGLHRT